MSIEIPDTSDTPDDLPDDIDTDHEDESDHQYECDVIWCPYRFETHHGMRIHMGSFHTSRELRPTLMMELRRVAATVGRSPSAGDMHEHGAYSPTTYINHFGSWNTALWVCGFDPNTSRERIAMEDLLGEIDRLADKFGETPTIRQLQTHGTYSAKPYLCRFGSWNEAVAAAGYDPNPPGNAELSITDLLVGVRDLAGELGRPPSTYEMEQDGAHSLKAYYRRFDSWADVLAAAGVTDSHSDTYSDPFGETGDGNGGDE